MSTTASSFYITGGTVPPGTPSYVERQADRDLYEGLASGEFCYVLHARQMGKSSLMVHTAARLREAGIAVVSLDLTRLGQNLSVEQWYDGLLGHLGRQLDLEDELEKYWLDHERLSPLQRWLGALHHVVLARVPGQLVIAVDEIDTVRSLSFSTDEFFAAIRDCYNRRSQDPEFGRLTFCLLGVATPSDLIQDTRTTPFNIGRRIELTDFTAAEATPLAAGLGRDTRTNQALLERALYWTAGHPYLTQRLCQALADGNIGNPESEVQNPDTEVDRLCAGLFLSPGAREKDDNILFVRERLLNSEVDRVGLLDLYAQVRRGQRVPDDEMDPFVGILRLSGVTRAVQGRLQVRNRIYAHVFDPEWVTAHMPGAELRRQREAFRRGAWRALAAAGVVLAVVGGLGLTALSQARRAERQRRRAVQQQRVAEAARLTARGQLYAAEMVQARQAWEAGVVSRAQDLLDSFRPAPGEKDLRGLEWYLLWRLCHPAEASAPDPSTGPLALGVASPDGRLLAVDSPGGKLELWDLGTRRQVASFTGYWDKELVAHFPPESKPLAASSWLPQKVRAWDVGGPRRIVPVLGSLPWGETNSISTLKPIAFSRDGRTFAVGTDSAIHVWDLAGRRRVADLPRPITGSLRLAFTAQGRLLATGSRGTMVEVWDVTRWQRVATFPGGFYGRQVPLFSPDGRLLAAPEPLDGRLRVWDIDKQHLLASFAVPPGNRLALAFSPDSRRLAVGGGDFTLRLLNLTTLAEEATFRGHRFMTAHVAFTPDGRWLVTNDMLFWPVARPDPDMLHAPGDRPWGMAFSPDGRLLITGGVRGQVNVWDVATRRQLAAWNVLKYTWSVACSPDGRTIAAGSWDDTDRVWDLPSRKLLYAFKKRPRADNHPVAFSPDGRTLAVSGGKIGEDLVLWDVASRREIARFQGHKSDIAGIAFFQGGRRVVTGCTDGTTRVWDIGQRRQVDIFPHEDSVYQIALSSDDRFLAIAGEGGLVNVWDARAHRKIAALKSYTGEITHLQFSPDGSTLLTSDQSGPLRLWSTLSWRETAAIQEPLRVSNAVALSPDGSILALGRSDGSIHLLHAANRKETDQPAPVTTRDDRQVLLQWPPVPAVQGYLVYRGPDNAPPSLLRKLTGQPLRTTSYRDTGPDVVSGRPLTYAVSALFQDTNGRTVEGPAVRTTAIRSVAPEGWTGSSINEGQNVGSVQTDAGKITLRGSGADFWGSADGGYFLNRPVNGDFRLTVQLDSGPTASDQWAKAGLMFREALDPGAREVHLVYTPSHLLECQWRADSGASTDTRIDIPPGRTNRPALLRLTRHGNRVTGEYSTDGGKSFRPAGGPLVFASPLSAGLRVGLAITAHNASQVSEAKFRNLRIEPLRR